MHLNPKETIKAVYMYFWNGVIAPECSAIYICIPLCYKLGILTIYHQIHSYIHSHPIMLYIHMYLFKHFMDLFDELIPLPSVEQISKLIDDASHYTNEMLHSIFAGWIGANAAVKSKIRGGIDRPPLGPFQCGPSVCTRMAGISGGIAVAMNAYGAHFVICNPDINEERKRAMLYAINHQFMNTIGMALAGVGAHYPTVTASLFAISSLLFCVPAYAFAMRNDRRLRALSPYGGVMAMLAWFSFIL